MLLSFFDNNTYINYKDHLLAVIYWSANIGKNLTLILVISLVE